MGAVSSRTRRKPPVDGAANASAHPDPSIAALARLFAAHPGWIEAAGYLSRDAESEVWFAHRPGEPWHLARRDARGSVLVPGPARDPDFVFRFPRRAIAELAAVEGGIGEFAVTLFELILAEAPDRAVGFRIAAPMSRLVRRGYLRLLLAAGPAVRRFGRLHGVANLWSLTALVARVRRRDPYPWEARRS